jgi:U1 small nuclear ribonucleoprotein
MYRQRPQFEPTNKLGLPPQIMALFAPRPPLPYLPPIEKPKLPSYQGVGAFISEFEDPKTAPPPPPWNPPEPRWLIRERIRKEREKKHAKHLEEHLTKWDPFADEKIKGDPRNTIIVARLSYKTDEKTLERQFDQFGPIKRIRIVKDLEGKPRGYAFIEYEHHSDAKAARRYGDGMNIDGKRVIVDSEKGRTQRGWRPRRLGGGLGRTREPLPPPDLRYTPYPRRPYREDRRRDYYRDDRPRDERRYDRPRYDRHYRDDRPPYRDDRRDRRERPHYREERRYRERDDERKGRKREREY